MNQSRYMSNAKWQVIDTWIREVQSACDSDRLEDSMQANREILLVDESGTVVGRRNIEDLHESGPINPFANPVVSNSLDKAELELADASSVPSEYLVSNRSDNDLAERPRTRTLSPVKEPKKEIKAGDFLQKPPDTQSQLSTWDTQSQLSRKDTQKEEQGSESKASTKMTFRQKLSKSLSSLRRGVEGATSSEAKEGKRRKMVNPVLRLLRKGKGKGNDSSSNTSRRITEMYAAYRIEASLGDGDDGIAAGSVETLGGPSDSSDARGKPRLTIDASAARLRRAKLLLDRERQQKIGVEQSTDRRLRGVE
ncbi:hypothetical protein M426DRAFT_318737 [Hypoxylon sp. CI-4A]|nr:hypothetical protein M426DRAFT_318737 [Hypoxylon sp. CI-4A]